VRACAHVSVCMCEREKTGPLESDVCCVKTYEAWNV